MVLTDCNGFRLLYPVIIIIHSGACIDQTSIGSQVCKGFPQRNFTEVFTETVGKPAYLIFEQSSLKARRNRKTVPYTRKVIF